MIILIDGDLISYRCAASSENDPVEVALSRCDSEIKRILYELNSEDYALYIKGENNFRYGIYPEYKANRLGQPAPKHLEPCREFMVRQWGAEVVNGMEVDDKLGIEQTRYGIESCIASFDKDLLQVPGHHYNFKHRVKSFVSPFDGLRTFYKQLIAGDGADNIPGYDGKVRNSVPKFIQKLHEPLNDMTEEWDMWDYVTDKYNEIMFDSADSIDICIRNAKLLYILREENVYWEEPGLKEELKVLSSQSLEQGA